MLLFTLVSSVSYSFFDIRNIQLITVHNRLNFDYDMRRGTDCGPWNDGKKIQAVIVFIHHCLYGTQLSFIPGIPFDGRDVVQFYLIADDSLDNMWRAEPTSFLNLGPDHRPRCWPWSNDTVLPYERYVSCCTYECTFTFNLRLIHHMVHVVLLTYPSFFNFGTKIGTGQ